MNVEFVKGLINKNKQTAAQTASFCLHVFIPLSVNIIQKKNESKIIILFPILQMCPTGL